MGSYWRFPNCVTDGRPLGNEMAANDAIPARVGKPTIVVGRIMTLDHAGTSWRAGPPCGVVAGTDRRSHLDKAPR
jgi:hypothetical protein